MLTQFRLSKFELGLTAKDRLVLPPYKGSTLRGGFGSVFRKISCSSRDKTCSHCLLKEKCPYSYIFETSPPQSSDKLSKNSDIPRPFIIEPPLETKLDYKPKEMLRFNLILVGRGIDYLPYFLLAFKELGEVGIGKGRGKYELTRADAIEIIGDGSEKIYSSEDETVKNVDHSVTAPDLEEEWQRFPQGRLTINFVTPTRLKFNKTFVNTPEFHVIIRNLLRRISSLSYFHSDEELNVNYQQLIKDARKVSLLRCSVRWVDWNRYSRRQQNKMNLGGFIGKATYSGDLERFLPLLTLGQYVHVGKGCVFGLGKYEILR